MVRRFLYLNGVAITSVVLFHAAGMGFVAMFSWAQRNGAVPGAQLGSLSYYALRLVEQFVAFSIAAFLVVSGYFVGIATGKTQKTVGWKVIISRVTNLAIPYLIWTAIALTLRFIEGQRLSLAQLVQAILIGRTNEVYYFIPLLIQFYLIAPILVRWEKANWRSLLFVTGLIQLLVTLVQYPTIIGNESSMWHSLGLAFPKWLFVTRIFWFSIGITLADHITDFKRVFYPLRWLLLGTAAVLIPVGFLEWEGLVYLSGAEWISIRETLIDVIYTLTFILGLLAFDKGRFPFFDSFSFLGTKSFGIYLTHALVIEYSARLIYRFFPRILTHQIVFQPVLITLGLGLPLLLLSLVDNSPLRRFSKYLFG